MRTFTVFVTAWVLGACYGAHTDHHEPEGVAGAPAPVPVAAAPLAAPTPAPAALEPEDEPDTCSNNSTHPDWFACIPCRSVNGCRGADRHWCCNDAALDGERYSADCVGFCEPDAVAMVDRAGVISCLPDLGVCAP